MRYRNFSETYSQSLEKDRTYDAKVPSQSVRSLGKRNRIQYILLTRIKLGTVLLILVVQGLYIALLQLIWNGK